MVQYGQDSIPVYAKSEELVYPLNLVDANNSQDMAGSAVVTGSVTHLWYDTTLPYNKDV